MTQEQLSYSIHLFQSAESCKETYKKTIVLWCISKAFHASNLEPFDVPDTLKYITNQSRTLVMANSHRLLPWWLKASHSESNTKAERYNNLVWTHMRSKHSNQQLNIERHKEWNMTGQLWAASSRETDGCTLGTERVPRRVMERGQTGGTERFEVIICKVCPRGGETMLFSSQHPSYTVAPAWAEHAHTNMQTQDAHTNQK